jgi:proteasome accessory factor C
MAERKAPAFQAADKLAFLLSLVPYLMDHDRVTVADAAAHFGVTEQQIEDAVNLIGLSGIPGDTAAYLHGDLFEVDYDALERGEIVVMNFVAIDEGASPRFSAREAAALIAGLQYLSALPENADRETLAALMGKLSRAASAEPARVAVEQSDTDETVALIRSAMDARMRIDFDYVNAEGDQRRRTVEPLRVESVDATWYLRGWDTDREAPRTFRIDRMSAVARSSTPITHRPDEVPLSDSLFQGSGDDLVVTLEVAKSALPLLADYVPEGVRATEGEGRVRTAVRVSHYSGLKRLLAGMAGVATVVEPEAARKAVAEWAAAGAAQYRG